MKKRKIMMSAMSAALVGVVAIGGTLAYLSAQSNQVTNTFNVGAGYIDDGKHVGLWLDEVDVTNPQSRTEEGNTYEDMLPGSTVVIDPTFHMTEGSTQSYVIAKVTGMDDAMMAGYIFKNAAGNIDFNGEWVKVAGLDENTEVVTPGGDGYYIYTNVETGEPAIVDASEAEDDIELVEMFNTVTLTQEIDSSSEMTIANNQNVYISGAAVQATNNTPEDAIELAIDLLR